MMIDLLINKGICHRKISELVKAFFRFKIFLSIFSKEFSLKSDADFTFPTQFQRKLGQNLK